MEEVARNFNVTLEEPILVYPDQASTHPPSLDDHELLQTVYLSPLDLQAPLFMYTLYFYKREDHKYFATSSEVSVFEVLKKALQKVLVLYYPAAGRIKPNAETGKAEIECSNEGVLLVKAASDARIEELGDPFNTDPELEKFVYKLRPTAENAVVVIQVTMCACGGFVIGFGTRHELFDAFSALQFLSAWGALARGVSLSAIPIPSHNRELLKSTPSTPSLSNHADQHSSNSAASSSMMQKFEGIPLLKSVELLHKNPHKPDSSWEGTVTDFAKVGPRPHYITKVFKLTKDELDHLKHRAMQGNELTKCSTFEVVTAHAWRARVLALSMDSSERVMLRFPVDGRQKLNDPPLPPCFIGNVFVMASHSCKVGDIIDSPLSDIVKRVQQAKADVTSSYIRGMINALAAMQEKALPSFRETTIVTDWTRFPQHLMDFGWGGASFATQVAMPLLDVMFLTSFSSKDEELFVRLGLLPSYMLSFEHHFLRTIQPQPN